MIYKAATKTSLHTFTKHVSLLESLKNAGVGVFLTVALNRSVQSFSFNINLVNDSKTSFMLDFSGSVTS